jgi:hypothetical protein
MVDVEPKGRGEGMETRRGGLFGGLGEIEGRRAGAGRGISGACLPILLSIHQELLR